MIYMYMLLFKEFKNNIKEMLLGECEILIV